jgi:epoxyqueuosine reductase QueG
VSFISELKSNYTNKRINKIKQLEVSVNNKNGAIKSNYSSPEMVSVNKKTPFKSLLTMLSIGKNIEYNFKSLKNNPAIPKTAASSDFIKEFENYAKSRGIKSIGYIKVPPEIIFKDKAILYGNAIVLTKEIDKNEVDNEFPGKAVTDLKLYDEFGKKTNELADYLREKGFGAHASHPAIGSVTYPTLAQYAGLGWRGKSNLLITPELGPRQKISAIFASISNLPLNEVNEHDWIPYYCDKCGKCVKACPEKALVEKETCCGGTEIELVQKNCIGCSQGCTYCIEACPFEEKGYEHVKNKFDKMNAKLKEKQNKKFNVELWNNWAKQNSNLFTDLVDGSKIAIAMTGNNERLIFLEKENDDLNASIKPLKELESSNADLLFVIDEKDIGEILNADDPSKFVNLLSCGKIEVYGLMDHLKLADKGYTKFLNNLGLNLGGGSCCG